MSDPLKIQCRATSRRSGDRCRNWAVTGALVCRMHGAGGSGESKHDPARKAKERIEDAEAVLRQRLFDLHEPALRAVASVLEDERAKPADKLRAADTILNRFVPTKAETKVTHVDEEAHSLDDEIMAAAGIEDDEDQVDAG